MRNGDIWLFLYKVALARDPLLPAMVISLGVGLDVEEVEDC